METNTLQETLENLNPEELMEEVADVEVKNKGKKRLNLDLTPDAYKLLQKLSQDSGKNMTEVLRTGLALYGIAQEESQKGNNLAITNGENIVARIAHI
jgi:hypothetical protein